MGDPIEKQRALVSALTEGRVNWTIAHREALRAALDKAEANYPKRIWEDIHEVLLKMMTSMRVS